MSFARLRHLLMGLWILVVSLGFGS